jgi:hypothetical protein
MMRTAWLWFNRISTVVGLAFMLAEGCAWSWSSIRAGHVISLWHFHQQFEQRLFHLMIRQTLDGLGISDPATRRMLSERGFLS